MPPLNLWILTFFLFVAMADSSIASHCKWTPTLERAYREATSLQLEAAEGSLSLATAADPQNLMALHVANYIDFFRVYIDEDESEFSRLEENRDARLKRIEKEGDPNSPWHRFLLADIRLQWALARLKYEQFTTAFFEANKAFKLLKANAVAHPEFMPNYKDLGILHAMAGTVPDNYRWAMEWFTSLEGTLQQGRDELEKVLAYARENDFIYEEEIYIYYTYLQLHLVNDRDAAWELVNEARLNPSENPLHCFVLANVAMRTGRGEEAIRILENAPSGNRFHPFHYLEYLLGLAKLQALDLTAEKHFLAYVNNFRGFNFIKDAYQKLAWCRLLKSDLSGYHAYINLCKARGKAVVGNDKSALNEAKDGSMPTAELLKARLLFDGGHYQRALQVLKTRNVQDYFSEKNRLEYHYRMARIEQALGNDEKAIKLYDLVISQGKKAPWYFACRAALEKGHIYEAKHQKTLAINAFEQCLNIEPEAHKTGLHQQAKAGLRRLQ